MTYISTIQYLSNIEHKFFHSFNESSLIQATPYHKPKKWFTFVTKGSANISERYTSSPSNKYVADKVIYHKKLHEMFFRLIDPLKTYDEMITQLCTLLDTHTRLLKEITPHYKKLQSTISSYITDKTPSDLSYINEKYMMFWSRLLQSNVYIIKTNSFKVYKYSEKCNKDILIKISEDGEFEYINNNLNEYMKTHTLFEKVDCSKLGSKTIEELRKICSDMKIEIGLNKKKKDLIQSISEVLI